MYDHRSPQSSDMKSPVLRAENHSESVDCGLESTDTGAMPGLSKTSLPGKRHSYALVAYGDDYVQPLILSALQRMLPAGSLTFLDPPPDTAPSDVVSLAGLLQSVQADDDDEARIMQMAPYERIDFAYALAHPRTCLVNSFVFRKALTRKHFLSRTVENWVAKHPDSVLRTHVKRSEAFELDYAEFLDDALVEAFDLRASLARNKVREESGERAKEYWILKPAMSDRGQGIRLFSSLVQLQGIFEEWDAELSDSQGEDVVDEDHDQEGGGAVAAAAAAARRTTDGRRHDDDDGRDRDDITTSHLRHFVAQPYVDPPMLVDKRKFHVRTYVLVLGRKSVYVYRDMLALFARKEYRSPSEVSDASAHEHAHAHDLDVHLTNTCLQSGGPGGGAPPEDAVRRFWDLRFPGPGGADAVFTQICAVTGELFEAAALGTAVHFQPLSQAFEVYGLDYLVDHAGTAWLLEVNAFPDFAQTGHGLRGIVAGFWDAVLRLAVLPFLGLASADISVDGDDPTARRACSPCDPGPGGMVLVKELHLPKHTR